MKQEEIKVYKKKCPVCDRPSIHARSIAESQDLKDSALWYSCSCGVTYQNDPPETSAKNASYIQKYKDIKEYEDIADYRARIYAPIVEELTYGRKLLDVGFTIKNNMEHFQKRGWLTFGIDNNEATETTDRIQKIDFESEDIFKVYPHRFFNVIWMSFVIEWFKNPCAAIEKAWHMLEEDGVLFISTPDTDFLYSKPPTEWSWWNRKEHYIYWNERSLCRELEKRGFNIILKRRNYYQRLGHYHDLQIIAQKIYF